MPVNFDAGKLPPNVSATWWPQVVITDGGEEFTASAMTTLRENLEKNKCHMSDDLHGYPDDADHALRNRAQVSLERLTWGNHAEFLGRHGDLRGACGTEGGFDFVLAADVICECPGFQASTVTCSSCGKHEFRITWQAGS